MALKLSDIVSITGVSGLHRVVKADAKNVLIESLDEVKKRSLVRGNMLVSKLSDISMYIEGDESESLAVILANIQTKYGTTLPVDKKSSNQDLLNFLESVLPNYDKERVYASNVKKLVQWYQVLVREEVSFQDTDAQEAEAPAQVEEVAPEEIPAEKPKKKSKK